MDLLVSILDSKQRDILSSCQLIGFLGRDFKVNIYETKKISLRFLGLKAGGGCASYPQGGLNSYRSINNYKTLERFIKSHEVKSAIPDMFPFSEGIDGYEVYNLKGNLGKNFIKGSCDKTQASRFIHFQKAEIFNIEQALATKHSTNSQDEIKVIVITDKSYMDFTDQQTNSSTAGWVLGWFGKDATSKNNNIKRYHDVAFIRSDQINTGTVAHELAHTLAQGVEFYKFSKAHNIPNFLTTLSNKLKISRIKNTVLWIASPLAL